MAQQAAVGIAVHSAWVAGVTVAGRRRSPTFIGRARLALVGDGLPDQAYHQAAESGLSLAEAGELIDRWAAAAQRRAREGIHDLIEQAADAGATLGSCAIAAVPKQLPPLSTILRSHPLLHAGEGQLALNAVADAAIALGLRVLHCPSPGATPEQLIALGRQAGPPWAADQKKAAAAAIDALPR